MDRYMRFTVAPNSVFCLVHDRVTRWFCNNHDAYATKRTNRFINFSRLDWLRPLLKDPISPHWVCRVKLVKGCHNIV